MSFSPAAAILVLDGTPPPATLYLQLHIGDPGPDGTANVATLSDRKAFTRTTGSNPATNVGQISWTSAPATETVTHATAWSALTSGTCWFIDAQEAINLTAGAAVTIDAGLLSLTLGEWT